MCKNVASGDEPYVLLGSQRTRVPTTHSHELRRLATFESTSIHTNIYATRRKNGSCTWRAAS